MTSLLDLPLEILDCIVDLLCEEPKALSDCCLVSKLLFPRARNHLFSDVNILDSRTLQRWSRTFPDPQSSPARHARSLLIGCVEVLTTNDANEGSLIRSFTNVESLEVWGGNFDRSRPYSPFVPLHSLSSVKSLRIWASFLLSEVIKLLRALPLLENLSLLQSKEAIDDIDECRINFQHQPSPTLTGTLVLQGRRLKHIVRLLSALPTGHHFRKIWWKESYEKEIEAVMALMEKCCNTLEYIHLEAPYYADVAPRIRSIDLSKATKLKEAVFEFLHSTDTHAAWIDTALQTITSKNRDFQQISVHFFPLSSHIFQDVRLDIGKEICQQWMNLDNTLVRLCESRGLRMKAVISRLYHKKPTPEVIETMRQHIEDLLPQMTEKGLIDAAYSQVAQ